MANVRATNGTTDKLFLGGSGSALSAGWGLMWMGRLMTLAGTEAIMAAVDAPSTTMGVLYYDATVELSFGATGTGDQSCTTFTLNTTDVWLLGFTKAAGTTDIRFHARNLTTAAAAVHANATNGSALADAVGAWDRTEIGTADGGTFFGNKRHGSTAVFTSAYSDANFDSVLTSTAQINALTPARLWDFNQASTATAVVNLMTGSADQTSITGTSVVADTAFDFWTFGVGGGGGATVTSPAADATGDLPDSAVSAGATPTSPAADTTGTVPTPTISADANVTSPAADGTGTVPVPGVSGGTNSTVTAPAADGTGDVPDPAVSAGANVTSPAAQGTGDLPSGDMSLGAEIVTGSMSGTGTMPAPTVTGTGGATVTAPAADGTGTLPIPGVSAGAAGSVTAPAAQGTGDLPTPGIAADATVSAPPVDGTGQAPAPTVSASATVAPGAASGTGDLPSPIITAGGSSTVAAPSMSGLGDLPVPDIETIDNTPFGLIEGGTRVLALVD